MYSLKGENPTKLYLTALTDLVEKGDTCQPRGKLIKELRPASIEFTNPYNRVTFLGGRKINPFFQIAESLWILSGRADVEWLIKFNANMKQFSDDGVWFNAPYGERLRSWGKNALHNTIINPIDQMMDAYTKLLHDKDTRQAVMVISNPSFDNSKYTIGEQGKDIACNLVVTFKIRNNRLNMTVFNRSNDAHWGLWGANLCQFTTIQETMWSWLKNSGNSDFEDLNIGDYCQVTDSLHIYLDDYGSKCTTDVFDYYKTHDKSEVEDDFTCVNEPRMSLSEKEFERFLTVYWNIIDSFIVSDSCLMDDAQVSDLLSLLDEYQTTKILDEYWYFGIKSMISYRLLRLEQPKKALEIVCQLQDCQWKISMLYFLKYSLVKIGTDESRMSEFQELLGIFESAVESVSQSLQYQENKDALKSYLLGLSR